jgi:hypothetical protein
MYHALGSEGSFPLSVVITLMAHLNYPNNDKTVLGNVIVLDMAYVTWENLLPFLRDYLAFKISSMHNYLLYIRVICEVLKRLLRLKTRNKVVEVG